MALTARRRGRWLRLSPERRLFLLVLAAGAPGILLGEWLLWRQPWPAMLQWSLTVLAAGSWLGFAVAARERVAFSLRTFANLLSALREGDYSIRAHGAEGGDAFGELSMEINILSEALRRQRVGSLEIAALLNRVVDAIDVAVFTFDAEQRLRLVNRAGERLLARGSERLLGRTALELGLAQYLTDRSAQIIEASFPAGPGRWDIRERAFREGGRAHRLLLISDLSRPLREEERQAWMRLIRVLGHEINNSLAPVISISGSLAALLHQPELPEDWLEDAHLGLRVISSRAESLNRFMASYTRLARMPRPTLRSFEVGPWIERVARLEVRLPVTVKLGPAVMLQADSDQLEQALINLIKNAVEASLETGGTVSVAWMVAESLLEIEVLDEGRGLSGTTNLFVPFFTTKPGGSGIGLVFSRQIAEAHGGVLSLENREAVPGCRAMLRLPLHPPHPPKTD